MNNSLKFFKCLVILQNISITDCILVRGMFDGLHNFCTPFANIYTYIHIRRLGVLDRATTLTNPYAN